jgi:phage FluMu protein Com
MTYQEYRCMTCAKLLFKGILVDSEVEVKCRGCGNVSTFHGVAKEKLICFVEKCAGRRKASESVA